MKPLNEFYKFCTNFMMIKPTLKFLIPWLIGFIPSVYYEFGSVYFLISLLIGMWLYMNTGDGQVRAGPSAYSVFNKGGESLPGTFKPNFEFWKSEKEGSPVGKIYREDGSIVETKEVNNGTKKGILPTPVYTGSKINRNLNCPCGSGKKYKKCCGDPSIQNIVLPEDDDDYGDE
eukprot:TRINITY_DN2796_c0_g2_i1.p1 TRINITY_DN2796_c0_g2~~TRINITY_DN2796_c0_g2_i1.p1  ORF type:complete len:174 (+),score=20.95 TRINITY_DN2796_c0_g2_i1:437-958(+)